MKKLLIGLLSLSLVILHCDAETRTGNGSHQGEEGRLIRHLLDTGYDVRERPFVQDGGPVLFNLTLYLIAISDLDARTQILSGISWLVMDWYDERLTWDPEDYAGIGSFTVDIDQTWSPKLYLQNTVLDQPVNPIQHDVTQTYISYDGQVHLESPLLHHTSCDMKIHKFPFDEQECWLRFTMQNAPIHLVRVDSSSVQVANGRREISSEWDIIRTYTRSDYVSIKRNITYENMGVCFKLHRLPGYYIDNVTSPIAILSWLSIIIFIIPAKSGERLSAAISLVLGLTVFQLVVTDNLPKNSRGDTAVVTEYVGDCFIITMVVTVMSAIVINLSHREGEINNKFIRSVFFNHLGPWCFVGGGGYGGKKASGSNPNESCKAGGLELKDIAAQIRSSDDVRVKRESTCRFDEQAKSESPKIHDFELLARVVDRLFLIATLVSLTAVTVKFLMEM